MFGTTCLCTGGPGEAPGQESSFSGQNYHGSAMGSLAVGSVSPLLMPGEGATVLHQPHCTTIGYFFSLSFFFFSFPALPPAKLLKLFSFTRKIK